MVHKFSTAFTATFFCVVLLVSGCSTPTWTSPPGSERYQVGYRDGCDAGYAVAGSFFYERIDSAEPAHDDVDYVHGWQSGYVNCKNKQEHFQATLHSLLGAGYP